MPKHEELTRFCNEYKALQREQKEKFRTALHEFIGVLKAWEANGMSGGYPTFPAHLGVTRMVGHKGIWEFRWSGDGRCTWSYGDPEEGKCSIIWRRIGKHDAVYDDP